MVLNIAQLMWKMQQKRVETPERFEFFHVAMGNRTFSIYNRKVVVKATITSDNDIWEPTVEVVYADQHPYGKSAEAALVRQGKIKPHEVGWLYITNFNGRRLWLGKIVKGRPIPFVRGEYDKDTRTLNLSL
jgi:hypothetical protein